MAEALSVDAANVLGTAQARPLAQSDSVVAFFANAVGDHYIVLATVRALGMLRKSQLRLICIDTLVDVLFGELQDIRLVRINDF